MSKISVIIPCRDNAPPEITLAALDRQTFRDFTTHWVFDQGRGSNWARNEGFRRYGCTEYVLFSDDDIEWRDHALEVMANTLRCNKQASYSYGAYETIGGPRLQCDHEFSANRLRRHNYISTMSLIRSSDFPGFDENIKRLQDWDLWLTMLEQGKVGVYCNTVIFSTRMRAGITYGTGISYVDAERIVRQKHRLNGGSL